MKRVNYKNIIRRFLNAIDGFNFFYPYRDMKIVGVTGTNGKTTTATLLYKIAKDLGYKTGLVSTVETLIGDRPFVRDGKGPGTSPDTADLHKILKEMKRAGCEYVFMEATSMAMDQNRLAGIRFKGGIFTNLTQDHLDYHKTMEHYFKSKKRFFKELPKDSFAISNADDLYGKKMLESIKALKYLYEFSDHEGEAILNSPTLDIMEGFQGSILKSDFSGLTLDINGTKVNSKLLGKFNAYNILAVWGACKLLGFDMEKVKKIVENTEPPTGRFDHFTAPDGVLIIVDYAHTPDALENVLTTVREIRPKGNRIISVFGCGGDRDPLKRPKMGKIGARLSDVAIFTSDNPRNEDPDKIIAQMATDLSEDESKKVITISDRRLAIGEAVKIAVKGDIILCAGKGHEDYQEVNGVKNHFSDLEEFKKLI